MNLTENPLRLAQPERPPSAPTDEDTRLAACPREVRDILESVRGGAELDFAQALTLATAQDESLDALVAVADTLRRESAGDAITYVVNRNINFTNVCFV